MNPDGCRQTNLAPSTANDWGATWSGDGSQIVFVSNRDGGDEELYVMNADGSGQTRLTTAAGLDWHPAW